MLGADLRDPKKVIGFGGMSSSLLSRSDSMSIGRRVDWPGPRFFCRILGAVGKRAASRNPMARFGSGGALLAFMLSMGGRIVEASRRGGNGWFINFLFG